MPENMKNFSIVTDIDKVARISKVKSIKIEYKSQVRLYTRPDGKTSDKIETTKPILIYDVCVEDDFDKKALFDLYQCDSENRGVFATIKVNIILGNDRVTVGRLSAVPDSLSPSSTYIGQKKILITINSDDMNKESFRDIKDVMIQMRDKIGKSNEKRRMKSASSFENRFEIMDLDKE